MKKGFTLVEMLIVIAIIGVLAVAVLSAINPIEQMRKARDTRRKSNASELLNAVERYYATNEANPPTLVTASGADDTCAAALGAGAIASTDLAELVSSKELKQNFIDRVDTADNELYVGIDATSELVAVCSQIESDANITKYNAAANCCVTGGGACTGDSAANNYICVPE